MESGTKPPTASASEVLTRLAAMMRAVRELTAPSAKALADRLGLDNPNQLTRYETGKRTPDLAFVVRFAEETGVTTDLLLRGVGDRISPAMLNRLGAKGIVLRFEEGGRSSGNSSASPAQPGPSGTHRDADNARMAEERAS